jgi:HSP20 family protein
MADAKETTMANITRFDPFDEPFENLFRNLFWKPVAVDTSQRVQMKIEVKEDEKAYTVRADIPGVKKEDIKVSVEGNQVSIGAEVKQEKEEKKGEKVIHSERYYGSLYRSFTLGHDIAQGEAQAKYTDGVLELVLPKSTAAQTRQISVQ